MTPDQDVAAPLNDSHVYVIVAGQLQLPRRTVKRRLTKVVEESIGGVLQSQLEGDLLKTYLLARFAGADFALTPVPKDINFKSAPLASNPVTMWKLFETGYHHLATGLVGVMSGQTTPKQKMAGSRSWRWGDVSRVG